MYVRRLAWSFSTARLMLRIERALSPITINICTTPHSAAIVPGMMPMADSMMSRANTVRAAIATPNVHACPALGAMSMPLTWATASSMAAVSISLCLPLALSVVPWPSAMNSARHFSMPASSSTACRRRSVWALSLGRLPSHEASVSLPPVVTERLIRLKRDSCPNTSMSKVKACDGSIYLLPPPKHE